MRYYTRDMRPRNKPHIAKRNKDWVCFDSEYFGRAKKPATAYRSYVRNIEFKQRYPEGLRARNSVRTIVTDTLKSRRH